MKKLIYIMLVAVAIMTVACGGKTQTNEEKATEMCQKMLDAMKAGNEDSVSVLVMESYNMMKELEKTDTVAYKEYLAAFEKFNKEHAAEIENTSISKNFFKERAEKAAESISDSLNADVKELSDDAKAAANEKIEAGKKAVSDEVAKEKAAANEKIEAGKKAVSDEVAKEKAAAKEKINNILK